MPKYYGTAVLLPSGVKKPLTPLKDVVWCEESGVPCDQCVGCKHG